MVFRLEEEAPAIRTIFEQWVSTDIGANGLAKYLENHGIHKIARHNGKNPLFDSALIRRIIKNPVYCGKIAYGRRKTEKVHGTRNEYKLVEQDDYLVVDGLHEGIVSEELWNQAQVKMIAQAKKYEHVNKAKDTKTHLLSGLVKCPVCGAGMYGNKSIKHRKDFGCFRDRDHHETGLESVLCLAHAGKDQYEGGHHGHRSGDQGAGETAEAVLRHEAEDPGRDRTAGSG